MNAIIPLTLATLITLAHTATATEPLILHQAARMSIGGQAVDELIAAGADLEARDEHGHTALHAATLSERDGANSIGRLLAAGADPNARDPAGHTPLHLAAARFERTKDVRRLLRGRADPNARANDGATPLHYAAGHGERFAVRELLSGGADPNARDNAGNAPLHYLAAKWRFSEDAGVAGLAMYAGVALGAGRRTAAATAILASVVGLMAADHQATKLRRTIDNLLDRQAIPTLANHAGETPADIATRLGYTEIAAQLASVANPRTFHDIVRRGTPDQVAEFAAKGNDPNQRNRHKWTATMLAVGLGRPAVLEGLLEAGADPNLESYLRSSETTRTPLHLAATHPDPRLADILLAAGADPLATDKFGYTVLHAAAHGGKPDVVRRLIEAGADVNAVTRGGTTPLHETTAAATEDFDAHAYVASLLIAAGSALNPTDHRGDTPLHAGAMRYRDWHGRTIGFGHSIKGEERIEPAAPPRWPRIVRERDPVTVLIKAGADPYIENNRGMTPLAVAATTARTEAVKGLIAAGVNPNHRTRAGDTALHLIARSSLAAMVPVLTTAGADPNMPDGQGYRPLELTLYERGHRKGRWTTARALLDAGADVRNFKPSKRGESTPTLVVARKGSVELMKALLAAGADPNARTHDRAPLHSAAARWKLPEMVDVLIHAGADLDSQTEYYLETPLHFAARFGHWSAIEALLSAGANPLIQDNKGVFAHERAVREPPRSSTAEDKARAVARLEAAMREWHARGK